MENKMTEEVEQITIANCSKCGDDILYGDRYTEDDDGYICESCTEDYGRH